MKRNNLVFTLKASVAIGALLASAIPLSTTVEAGGIKSGRSSDKTSLTVSGQVNRAVLFADDGENSEVFNVDNDNSSTRVRWVGTAKVTDDFTIGSLIEVQFESASTADVNQNNGETNTASNSFTERHLTFYLDSKKLGRLWLGQGDTASNGTAEVDLSGTSVVQYSGIADMSGGVLFQDENNGHAFGPRINQAWNQNDGLSRNDRIRYDTPTLAGFKASVSHIGGGAADAALRYTGKFAGTKVSAAVAYINTSSNSSSFDDGVDGSISVLHDSGLNATFSAGYRDFKGSRNGDSRKHYYGKLGYIAKIFDIGTTNFAIDFGQADDGNVEGDEFTTYSAAAVQNLKEFGTQLYLDVRNHELDRTGLNTAGLSFDFNDVIAVIAGGRVKF